MNQFSNGILEFANLAVCSDLLPITWDAISEILQSDYPNLSLLNSVAYKVSQPPSPKGATIIAFASSPAACTVNDLPREEQKQGLVDSADSNFPLFEFLCTKVNPSISIDKATVDHFVSLQDQLSVLKDQIDIKSPLIVTGHSLGGSIASLFTLWLLETIYLKTSKRPICITFGSSLLGDNAFQLSISERPTWISCFLHIISNKDPIVRFIVSTQTTNSHMPFGTTLFLSNSGSACFDEPESTLAIIKAMSLQNREGSQNIDYGVLLRNLKYKHINGEIEEVDKCDINNPLRAGITLQLQTIGAIKENSDTIALLDEFEKKIQRFQRRQRNVFDPTKKLNEIKVYLIYMGWYKKVSKDQGGYYDCYKNAGSKRSKEGKRKENIVRVQMILTQYWQRMVAEVQRMPKRDGTSAIRSRWLYAGMNYRRMVEPLHIARYYKQGKRDYIDKGRSEHFKLLEQWEKSSSHKPAERNKVSSLTEDSCFWAHVEEAIINLCGLLNDGESSYGESKESLSEKLSDFEQYVLGLIMKFAVSTEIFEAESSFMKWWKDYKDIKGSSYKSDLTDFMNNKKLENGFITLDEYKKSS